VHLFSLEVDEHRRDQDLKKPIDLKTNLNLNSLLKKERKARSTSRDVKSSDEKEDRDKIFQSPRLQKHTDRK